MTLPELAIRRPVTTTVLLVSLVVLGATALLKMPLAFMPDWEEPQLFVRFQWANSTPEQVERMVVRPAEDALGSVSGLKTMWSNCDANGGVVRMEFGWDTDMHVARTEVWEKIDRVRGDLPDDLGDITVGTSWNNREADSPILEGRLSSKADLSASYDLLERKILRPIERIPGVASVRLDGVEPRELRINLRPADLERYGVDVREVSRVLRSSGFDQSLGHIETGDERWQLRTVANYARVAEVRELPLRADGLRLQDVADVVYAQPPLEYGRHLDGSFAVGLTVSQESKANTVEVCEEIRERIAAMDTDPELEGVNFLVWFDQGEEITRTLRDLMFTGIFGALLASVVLFFFLGRVGPTVVAVVSIPIALIVACGVLYAQGRTMNTLTLLGLIVGIGMLVDNAVVVMENIFRHQERGQGFRRAALEGSREVSVAVMAATLTSVIVFLPLIFNKPTQMNVYLKELGITVCLALLASLLVSQTLIPLATAWALRSRPRAKAAWMRWLEGRHQRLLAASLRHRWVPVVLGAVVAGSAYWPATHIDFNFDGGGGDLFAQFRYEFEGNATLEEREATVTRVEQALEPHRERMDARSIYSFWNDGFALTRVYLPEGEANPQSLEDLRGVLREVLPEIPGVKLEVTEGRQFWRQDRGKRVAFQVHGPDSEVLAVLAEEAKLRLGDIEGLLDPFSSNDEGVPELHVEIDRELVSRYGIDPGQAGQVVGLTYRGQRLPRFRTPQGEREMRLALGETEDETIEQLRNLPLYTEGGEKLQLGAIASFTERPGAERIQRDERKTSLWVGARYEDGTREQYMPQVMATINSLDFPYGYGWSFGRWQERAAEQKSEFLINLMLALLLIFAVMAGLFESVRQAVALMVALPFAVAGAFWTLYLTGTDFDQPAAVGMLLLIGIVVNNGIVMLEHINQYRRAGVSRTRALLRGGRERLRPIVMTAITTLVGLVPIVVQRPSLGDTYYYSMAYVIMGGLLVSTVLTTVLLPASASLSEDLFAGLGRLPGRLWRRVRPARPRPATRPGA